VSLGIVDEIRNTIFQHNQDCALEISYHTKPVYFYNTIIYHQTVQAISVSAKDWTCIAISKEGKAREQPR
jgi:hypothetical protein